MELIRLSAPSTYNWKISFAYDRFKSHPVDYIVFLVFIFHILGFFCLLVYLRVKQARKKLFMYSN